MEAPPSQPLFQNAFTRGVSVAGKQWPVTGSHNGEHSSGVLDVASLCLVVTKLLSRQAVWEIPSRLAYRLPQRREGNEVLSSICRQRAPHLQQLAAHFKDKAWTAWATGLDCLNCIQRKWAVSRSPVQESLQRKCHVLLRPRTWGDFYLTSLALSVCVYERALADIIESCPRREN